MKRQLHRAFLMLSAAILLCGLSVRTTAQKRPDPGAANQEAPGAPSNDIHQQIRSILSSPEYQPHPENESELSKEIRKSADQLKSTIDRVKRWLSEMYRRILQLFSGARGLKGSGNLYIIAFIILFAAAIGWFLYRYFTQNKNTVKRPSKPLYSETSVDHEMLIEALAKSPAEWLELAKEQSAAKRYREAIRSMFLRTICLMDRQGLLEFVPSETNRTLLGLVVKRSPNGARIFASMIHLYETAWYGELETSEAAYTAMISSCEAFEAETTRAFNGEAAHA
jgi:Domain of unknown function (DUF4129)